MLPFMQQASPVKKCSKTQHWFFVENQIIISCTTPVLCQRKKRLAAPPFLGVMKMPACIDCWMTVCVIKHVNYVLKPCRVMVAQMAAYWPNNQKVMGLNLAGSSWDCDSKLKLYCLIQHVTINSHEIIVMNAMDCKSCI